jgi:hypothetical protein
MKMLLGFFIGTTFALLLVLVMTNNNTPVSADAAPTPTPTSTENLDVTGLMPDVGQIYNAALGDPYRQVETEITDPDIANYFHRYMEDTGLDKVGAK